MKWLTTVVVILLLALWVPATSHALLENAGLIHQAASDGGSDHDHDAADGLCMIESGSFHVEKGCQSVELALAHFLSGGLVRLAVDVRPPRRKVDTPATGPPLLIRSWQFSSRAALPVRAPSFVS